MTLEWSRENLIFQGRLVIEGRISGTREGIKTTTEVLSKYLGYSIE